METKRRISVLGLVLLLAVYSGADADMGPGFATVNTDRGFPDVASCFLGDKDSRLAAAADRKATPKPPDLQGVYYLLLRETSECIDGTIPLPSEQDYGRIRGGDLSHEDKVDYCFEGTLGDVAIAYEVWDVDSSTEVEIRINGVHAGYAETTLNETWGERRYIVLPDRDVLDSGARVLTFNNIFSRSNSWKKEVGGDLSGNDGYNNLYYNTYASPGTPLETLDPWYPSDSVMGMPEFLDAPSGDFHLKPDSPAIDAGVCVNGQTHHGQAVDLGAIEYDDGGEGTSCP